MYIPPSYSQDEPAALFELMREYSFATLYTHGPAGASAVHLPFMVDADRGPHGTLIAHMARANPQWRDFDGSEVLVTFTGPHAYISPAWYANPAAVPTWNYAAVHAYGVPRIIEDDAVVRSQLLRLVNEHEAYVDPRWDPALAADVIDAQVKGVVGFEIPIQRLEGKWKFSQNRSRRDQAGVVAALATSADATLREVASVMRRNLALSAGGDS